VTLCSPDQPGGGESLSFCFAMADFLTVSVPERRKYILSVDSRYVHLEEVPGSVGNVEQL